MPVGTRSGRLSQDLSQHTGPHVFAGITKSTPAARGRGGFKRGARAPRASRGAVRGRGRGGRYASGPTSHHVIEAIPQPIPDEQSATTQDGSSKVERITNGFWQSNQPTISFIQNGHLDTDEDTETITLNLIDHILQPENWDERLSGNILATSCFYFASKLTGKSNSPEQIAASLKVDPAFASVMAMSTYGYVDEFVLSKIAESLSVSADDVRRGFEVLLEKREGLRLLVGEYEKDLEKMTGNEVNDGAENIPPWDSGTAENVKEEEDLLVFDDEVVTLPEEKASEAELDSLDFDVDDGEEW